MSLARRHRDRVLAARSAIISPAPADSALAAGASPADPPAGAAPAPTPAGAASAAEAAIALRLTHDLRRLHEIKSIDLKVAAKREMLPEYRSWVDGVLAADQGVGRGPAAEVVPVMMVWAIDTGDYLYALDLLAFLLRHDVPMPSRYNRDAATVAVEEIAEAALRAQLADEAFPLPVLDRVCEMTIAIDLHDEVRAKIWKAIGIAELALAEALPASDAFDNLRRAAASLAEAQRLNPRAGIGTRLKRAQKLLAAVSGAALDSEAAEAATPTDSAMDDPVMPDPATA